MKKIRKHSPGVKNKLNMEKIRWDTKDTSNLYPGLYFLCNVLPQFVNHNTVVLFFYSFSGKHVKSAIPKLLLDI